MEYQLTFTEEEINLILQALGELPAKLSYNLIGKIYKDIFEIKNKKKEEKKDNI